MGNSEFESRIIQALHREPNPNGYRKMQAEKEKTPPYDFGAMKQVRRWLHNQWVMVTICPTGVPTRPHAWKDEPGKGYLTPTPLDLHIIATSDLSVTVETRSKSSGSKKHWALMNTERRPRGVRQSTRPVRAGKE